MKTLFVDFHGTICHDHFWRSLANDDFRHVQQALFKSDPSLINDWMRGGYTSEEVNGFAAERTGIEFECLWRTFVRDCKSMLVSQELLSEIKLLRREYRVVLITDNMDCFDRFIVPELRLDLFFDDIANSYYERRLKTEHNGETFTKYLSGEIAHAVLVEDSNTSCRLFRNLGGTAHQVTSMKPAIRYLRNLGAS